MYSRPKDPLSLSILSRIIVLAKREVQECEVQEEFSEKGQKPKEPRPLREVSIAKSYPAILRYFFVANSQQLFLPSLHGVAICHFRYLFPFAFQPFFSSNRIPCRDGNTTPLSQVFSLFIRE